MKKSIISRGGRLIWGKKACLISFNLHELALKTIWDNRTRNDKTSEKGKLNTTSIKFAVRFKWNSCIGINLDRCSLECILKRKIYGKKNSK